MAPGKKIQEFLINLMKVLAKIFYICVFRTDDHMKWTHCWAKNLQFCLINIEHNIILESENRTLTLMPVKMLMVGILHMI